MSAGMFLWGPRYTCVKRQAGTKRGVFALPYATPVVGMRVPGGFVIPMAFGEGADWYRNIVASGGATIRQDGSEHHLVDPLTIDPDSAESPFPGWQRPVFRALGIRRFLFLKGR